MNNLDHVESINIKYHNKVNDIVDNKLKFDNNSILNINLIKDIQPVVTISLGGVKKFVTTIVSILT